MKLIVGLGNPGEDYANNRHNVGFMCVNHFARTHSIRFDKKQGKARIGMGKVENIEVMLARPQTYMNESGLAVSALVDRFNISLDNLIVIHDDLDLPLGKIRFRLGGGWTTHKGVKSVNAELGSHSFSRLRVGIGRPTSDEGLTYVDYVLSNFTPEENRIIDEMMPRVSAAILCFLTEGLTEAMNKYNQKS